MTTTVFHRIQSIVLVEPCRLRAVFTDGVQKEYDLRRWKDHPAFSILFRHPALQTAVRLEPGGYGVSWNENIDLAAEEIYYNGTDCDACRQNCPHRAIDVVSGKETQS